MILQVPHEGFLTALHLYMITRGHRIRNNTHVGSGPPKDSICMTKRSQQTHCRDKPMLLVYPLTWVTWVYVHI